VAPTLDDEGRNIDGIGPAMLAQPLAGLPVERPAAIASEALDPDDTPAEPGIGCGLNRFANPAAELARLRAGHRLQIGHRSADVEQLNRAESGAAIAEIAVGERAEADIVAAQVGIALQRFLGRLADRTQLGAGLRRRLAAPSRRNAGGQQ